MQTSKQRSTSTVTTDRLPEADFDVGLFKLSREFQVIDRHVQWNADPWHLPTQWLHTRCMALSDSTTLIINRCNRPFTHDNVSNKRRMNCHISSVNMSLVSESFNRRGCTVCQCLLADVRQCWRLFFKQLIFHSRTTATNNVQFITPVGRITNKQTENRKS